MVCHLPHKMAIWKISKSIKLWCLSSNGCQNGYQIRSKSLYTTIHIISSWYHLIPKKSWPAARLGATSAKGRVFSSSKSTSETRSASHLLIICSSCDLIPSGWWYTYPSEKYESQLGWWHSQYMGKNGVPNHQPAIISDIWCKDGLKSEHYGNTAFFLWVNFTIIRHTEMRLWTTKPRSSPSMDRFKGEFFYRKSLDTIDFFSILFRGVFSRDFPSNSNQSETINDGIHWMIAIHPTIQSLSRPRCWLNL